MRFAPTAEQEAFRETARAFLAERVRVRELVEFPGAHDPALWKTIAGMGWLGVDVPEIDGGQGLTFVETALMVEETGRALLPGPFLGTLMAIQAAAASSLLADLVTGNLVAAAALTATAPSVRLVRNRLRGIEPIVPCAEVADVLLIVASTPDGPAPFLVRASETTIETVGAADLSRPVARVRCEGAHIEERLDPSFLGGLLDRARVLVAADAVGGAAQALEMAVAHAKERVQFDRPIGSFQAVKHRAADAWRAVEAARLATWYAAWAIATGAADAHAAALAAKAAAGDAFVRSAADSIQIHGGIGFTWEHDAHLYYRRALADQAMLGDADEHRDAMAAEILAQG